MGALGWLLADRGAARRAFPASGVRALIVAGAIAAAGAAPAAQRPDGAEEAAAFYARYLVAVRDAKSVDDIVKFWSAALARQYAQAPPAERADLAGVKGIYAMHTQVSVTGGAVNQMGLVLGLTGLDARQDNKVTGTVTLVKEDGAWKVAAPENWAR
jgi:hypothetical protein